MLGVEKLHPDESEERSRFSSLTGCLFLWLPLSPDSS